MIKIIPFNNNWREERVFKKSMSCFKERNIVHISIYLSIYPSIHLCIIFVVVLLNNYVQIYIKNLCKIYMFRRHIYVRRSNIYLGTFLIQVNFILNVMIIIIKIWSKECRKKVFSDFLTSFFLPFQDLKVSEQYWW